MIPGLSFLTGLGGVGGDSAPVAQSAAQTLGETFGGDFIIKGNKGLPGWVIVSGLGVIVLGVVFYLVKRK